MDDFAHAVRKKEFA